MKVLVVGDWHSTLHEEAVYNALRTLGHEVYRFSWFEHFQPRNRGMLLGVDFLMRRAQNKYIFGPIINRINRQLIATVTDVNPDGIFVYRGTHILKRTLSRIRQIQPGVRIVGYNNDDPFSPQQPRWLWRHFLSSVPMHDLTLAYRKQNVIEYKAIGAKRVELLMPWYIPQQHERVKLEHEDLETYGCDVVFVGHYEADGRLDLLEEIAARGYKVKIYGPGYEWDAVLDRSSLLRDQVPVRLVWGQEYNKAICGAKIALCFLSRLNRDTYTRRCFEIPAAGTMLLSEYTDDLASLYTEGQEAVYFRGKAELLDKLEYYLSDDEARRQVAAGGYRRVREGRHDVTSRMTDVMNWIQEL